MNVMNQWALPWAPSLPLWVSVSWGLLLSALVLHGRAPSQSWRRLGVVVFLVTAMPTLHVAAYLALAFQTPSAVAVAWAVWTWRRALQPTSQVPSPLPVWVACVGVVLGWALVIDTLNSWPVWFNPQLYAWGFEATALWAVLAVVLAWGWWANTWGSGVVIVLGALGLFALTRWPTGNVWDALLDPFVWLALHVQLWQAARRARQPA